MSVVSSAQFLEYQERRRRNAVELKLSERPQTVEPDFRWSRPTPVPTTGMTPHNKSTTDKTSTF